MTCNATASWLGTDATCAAADALLCAASGGWSGFAFPNLPRPVGDFLGNDYGSNNPMQRPSPCVRVRAIVCAAFYYLSF